MTRLFMTTAIVALATLPTLAIAQENQATDPMTQEQADPQGEAGAASGAGNDDTLQGDGQNTGQADTGMDGTSPSETAGDAGSSGMDTTSDGMMADDGAAPSEGFSAVDTATVEADEIQGTEVLSRDGESIANVSDVLVREDGSIDAIIVNVGGFLGMGSKSVEVPFDRVTLQSHDGNGALNVIIPMSQQELEDMPEYDAG